MSLFIIWTSGFRNEVRSAQAVQIETCFFSPSLSHTSVPELPHPSTLSFRYFRFPGNSISVALLVPFRRSLPDVDGSRHILLADLLAGDRVAVVIRDDVGLRPVRGNSVKTCGKGDAESREGTDQIHFFS
jgi:hypothetical protein